jgi:integrase
VHQRRPVHIYTPEEIAALAAATSNLGQTRAQTFRTFLGLLICTGLRISEALRLRPQDLDLSGNTLLVQAVKSSPARRLPIHASTHRALHQYDRWCQRRLRAPALRPALFLNSWGRPLSRDAADDTFEELRDRLGWRQCPRPRLYDLRHSFAVHWLVCWNRRPGTLDANTLALSAYLGHRHVSDTYWYLTAVPELLAASSARFEQLAHRKPLALTP